MTISRRSMLVSTSAGLAALGAPRLLAGADRAAAPAVEAGVGAIYPTQDPALARETVGVSHANLSRVRELLSEHPTLANAAWDWGFGDWETALGAASHTGQREIAELLIKNGARPDMFTFAMLGELDVVKAYVAANPGIQRKHGPHGITLLRHAQAGGPNAQAVVDYLVGLGDADIGQPSLPVADDSKKLYLGEYTFGPRGADRFEVAVARNGNLTIQRKPEGSPRMLFRTADHTFSPAGAPQVRIVFAVQAGSATTLSIVDGPRRIAASRLKA